MKKRTDESARDPVGDEALDLSARVRLDGRRALVCGASSGIGRAIAGVLAQQGAEVILLARSTKALAATLRELSAEHGQAHEILSADLADTHKLAAQTAPGLAAGAPVHILINNSGGPAPGPASEAEADVFAAAFAQHVLAAQILTRALVPGMQSQGYGRIINVISTSVKEPIPGLGVSNTIRGAMASWAKTMATELGPFGITVNNLLPGYTATGRLAPIFAARARRSGGTASEAEEAARASVPVGRFAAPEEQGLAAAFLASPAAAYINGINLPVDGGRTQSL